MKVIAAYRKDDTTKSLVSAFFVPDEIDVGDSINALNGYQYCELYFCVMSCISGNYLLVYKDDISNTDTSDTYPIDVWALYNGPVIKSLRVGTRSNSGNTEYVFRMKEGLKLGDLPELPIPPSGNDAPMALQRANTVVNLGRL